MIRRTKVFAIADLHLSGKQDKPMGVFGKHWEDHWNKIKENWCKVVSEKDIIIIPGDISWAMHLEDAKDDLQELAKLPGRQIFVKGNHDYWWSSYTRVEGILSDKQFILQNNSRKISKFVIAGTRGWICPNSQEFKESDMKIYKREAMRLELSLEDAMKKADRRSALIVAMHYPPYAADKEKTLFTEVLEKYSPKIVVFGHIHSPSAKSYETKIKGTKYIMSACDSIDFSPIRIL
ncbi:MAG: metallophosphoesterase [Eubacteriales bacterium]